jgi:hypothetical protein
MIRPASSIKIIKGRQGGLPASHGHSRVSPLDTPGRDLRSDVDHLCKGGLMFNEVRRRMRERQLAGDGRAGSWSRTKARRRQWQFIRRQWRFFAITVVGTAAMTSFLMIFIRTEFLRGFVVGIAVAGTIGALAMLVMLVTGTAPISMGATAEQWTASELRPLKRAGWRVMNHVALRTWDIDHVLVGPGGVIAVETKWSSRGWRLDPPDATLARAVDQVRANARSLRLWHGVRSLGIQSVTPVVFVWGSNQDEPQPMQSTPRQMGEVTVISGVDAARAWRTSIQSGVQLQAHDSEQVRKLWDALDKHIRGRETHDRVTSPPPPPTLGWIYWSAVSVIVAAISSFIVGLQTLRLGSWWAWLICVLVLAAIGISARRANALQIPALGWLAGLGAAVLLVAVLELHRAIA